MYSTQYLTENYNFHSLTFAAARLVYRALSGVADDVERIGAAVPVLLHGIATLAVWLLTAVRFALPGLALCLVVFAIFTISTWAVN